MSTLMSTDGDSEHGGSNGGRLDDGGTGGTEIGRVNGITEVDVDSNTNEINAYDTNNNDLVSSNSTNKSNSIHNDDSTINSEDHTQAIGTDSTKGFNAIDPDYTKEINTIDRLESNNTDHFDGLESNTVSIGSGSYTSNPEDLRSRSKSNKIEPIRSRSRSNQPSNQRSRASTTGSFINFISDRKPSRGPKFFSLFKLFMLELNLPSNKKSGESTEFFSNDSYDQLVNLIKVPIVLEKFMFLGLLICLTSFLTLFTLVPIRILVIAFMAFRDSWLRKDWNLMVYKFKFARRDTITIALILSSLIGLSLPTLDISKMYHDVKGQAQIKLYVMFGVLEVADKLSSSIGQHILNVTYNLAISKSNHIKFSIFFGLSVMYLSIHAYILIYQTVSLNVAANSYSNALLTLLFSNQFSELRGSVFKKFEREGLFQLTMADLTERYQLSLMLGMIAIRNILQLNSISTSSIPNSWSNWNNWFGVLFGPSIAVLGSEILVDWLKHCYITKFNKIRPRIYNNFIYVLALDYLEVFKATSSNDHSEYELTDYLSLTRRIGLPLLATTVCFLRMSLSDIITIFTVSTTSKLYSIFCSGLLLVISFVIILLLRLILGLVLLKITSDIKQKHEQRFEDDFSEDKVEEVDTPLKYKSDIFESKSKILEAQESPTSPKTPKFPRSTPPPRSSTSPRATPSPRSTTPPKSNVSLRSPETPRSPGTPKSPKSPTELSFLPGIPNTEMSNIDPHIRARLYDKGEEIPLNSEEKRNKEFNEKYESKFDEGLNNVSRYEMTSKRIW